MNRSDDYNNMLAKIFAKSCGITLIYILQVNEKV